MRKVRFRTLGCYPLTGAIDSQDDTLEAIIDKLTRDSERHGTTGRGNLDLALLVNGLSGAGKSTIANLVEQRLHATGCGTMSLDGENVHHGLCRDLGFTPADRVENIRRVAHVAQLMAEAGLIVLVSLISPFRADPEMARSLWPPGEFLEIFVDTPLDICEARDVKGLYRKARSGTLPNFTGIGSPYEPPTEPDLRLDTGAGAAASLADAVVRHLAQTGIIPSME
ncbi:MAG: adenylyl-sulfate kinase [Niveispirillum sp.]|nr:adenylyl-sulfate kinase [Niveispirillum sp.]